MHHTEQEKVLDGMVKCCVCDEDHDRLELINFGSELEPRYVCFEVACLVDFINTIRKENNELLERIARQSERIRHALR